MTPTIVCFRWKPTRGYRSDFGPETVTALRNGVRANYPKAHRFVCITDAPHEIDQDIETFQLWPDLADVPNPHGAHNPSCYRRLKLFSAEAGQWFGERIIAIDLDTVIVGDLVPLFDRTEEFVIWGQSDHQKQWYNGSLFMLTAGTRVRAWTEFNPKTSPHEARRAGRFGSDQAWLSYCLGTREATVGCDEGVYSYRVHIAPKGNVLPENARIVFWHGKVDPWSYKAQQIPWVRENWRVAA